MQAPGQGNGLVKTVITATPDKVRISRVFKIFSKDGAAIFNLRYTFNRDWLDGWDFPNLEETACLKRSNSALVLIFR